MQDLAICPTPPTDSTMESSRGTELPLLAYSLIDVCRYIECKLLPWASRHSIALNNPHPSSLLIDRCLQATFTVPSLGPSIEAAATVGRGGFGLLDSRFGTLIGRRSMVQRSDEATMPSAASWKLLTVVSLRLPLHILSAFKRHFPNTEYNLTTST